MPKGSAPSGFPVICLDVIDFKVLGDTLRGQGILLMCLAVLQFPGQSFINPSVWPFTLFD